MAPKRYSRDFIKEKGREKDKNKTKPKTTKEFPS